jgi:hypothetical protein
MKGNPHLKPESFAALVAAIQAFDEPALERAVVTIAREIKSSKPSRKPAPPRKEPSR